jgi:integrase
MDPNEESVTLHHGPETLLQNAVESFLTSKGKAQGGGSYVHTARSILSRFVRWCDSRAVETIGDLGKNVLANYAGHLKRRVQAGAISPASAHTYYDIVSAFCAWAVRRELLDSNPARKHAAQDELPERSDDTTQQFWSPKTREQIVRWADWRTEDALRNEWMDGRRAVRDRALVAVLAFSGVRIAEILRDPRDDRRRGLRWTDVDLQEGTLRVLGKSQEWEFAQLPTQAGRYLTRHRTRQNPPTDDWPVFETGHVPSKYRTVRTTLETMGFSEAEIEETVGSDDIDDVLREYEIVPPSLSTSGGRRILRVLSEESGITEDGEPLKPHGARRGLGDTLYRESSELAQAALRHKSIETTHSAYSHIKASETSEDVGRILDDTG